MIASISNLHIKCLAIVAAWVGTVPAKRQCIATVLSRPNTHLAIIPGGIAEMYLMSSDSEGIYLRTRLNTVKLAIQEGIHIVPGEIS